MSQHRTLLVPQDRETAPQVFMSGGFRCRYAYARSADTQAANDRGQDYIAVALDDMTLCFALCDGVSQSFFGDLAAGTLGEGLVTWLAGRLPTGTADELASALRTCLLDLTAAGTARVQAQRLPSGLPPVVTDVLEEKRRRGSESTFVCGRIDLPGAPWPEGRLVLGWMGDCRLRLWRRTAVDAFTESEHPVQSGDTLLTKERWSTRTGPVGGDPHLVVSTLAAVGQVAAGRLLAYSDGLAVLDSRTASPSDADLQALIAATGRGATSDDVSLVEITWPTDSHATASLRAQPTQDPTAVPVLRMQSDCHPPGHAPEPAHDWWLPVLIACVPLLMLIDMIIGLLLHR